MSEPQLFNFHGQQLRTVLVDDQPMFVGKDVAEVLGYQNGSRDVNTHVEKEDRLKYQIGTSGQAREMTVINESGLYSLVLSSKMPNAKEFKHWVTAEVLPTIRRHGAYLTPDTIEKVLLNPDTIIELATQLKQERTGRMIAEQQVNELQPKADYYDQILANKGLVPITSIAKNYGMSARAFNGLLHEYGVQFNQSGSWYLYSKYQSLGYTHTEPIPFTHSDGRPDVKPSTKWTQKGHIFLYELLKKNGVLPMIEQGQEAR
ncbi:phage antirepressor [Lacticaseibacillus absianus]|uniref:phage antirepressor n=1 Tax=Lacticaseibacillus absianus TaxID=2729623 RepID=UPI0015CC6A76|nr:phage antirepressor [Lacticaseibacillus absianus]